MHGAMLGQVRATKGMAMRDTNLLQLALADAALERDLAATSTPKRSGSTSRSKPFAPGSRFPCPHCGAADCPAYDTQRMSWRHLNFFNTKAYLNASRAARPLRHLRHQAGPCAVGAANDSGFTLLFEALLMTMLSAMPVRTVGEDGRRARHTVVARAASPAWIRRGRGPIASAVTRVAIDETAARRGHDYITLFADIDQASACCSPPEGKDAATVAAFADDLAVSMAVTPKRSMRSAST